jgi:hypothetical protein
LVVVQLYQYPKFGRDLECAAHLAVRALT